MDNKNNETADVVWLTLDNTINEPDWDKINQAAAGSDERIFESIGWAKRLWESPDEFGLPVITVRSGKTLLITGEKVSDTTRTYIQKLKDLRLLEAGGFDGVLAMGTTDSSLAFWFTPDVISEQIDDNEDLDPDDFDEASIEEAIKAVLNEDISYGYFDELRMRIIEVARGYTASKNAEVAK